MLDVHIGYEKYFSNESTYKYQLTCVEMGNLRMSRLLC